jgi:hypothetical protein
MWYLNINSMKYNKKENGRVRIKNNWINVLAGN